MRGSVYLDSLRKRQGEDQHYFSIERINLLQSFSPKRIV